MLVINDIEITDAARNSDGDVVLVLSNQNYVALYDDEVFDESFLKDKAFTENFERYLTGDHDKPFVLLTKKQYEKLSVMIHDNMVPKS